MSNQQMRRPDGITEEHEAELRGFMRHASPAALLVLGVVVATSLFGVFGLERTLSAEAEGVRLEVATPVTIRNGEIFEMRMRVDGGESVDELVIGVDEALWRDMTVNTVIPAPSDERSIDGEFRFSFGALESDVSFAAKVDLQVNPDILGGNGGTVRVYDGDRLLVELPIEIGVLP